MIQKNDITPIEDLIGLKLTQDWSGVVQGILLYINDIRKRYLLLYIKDTFVNILLYIKGSFLLFNRGYTQHIF